MVPREKPLVWLHGQIETPPFSEEARIEAGYLLGRLQQGESLGLPHSRPMPSIGRRCHELRVPDKGQDWRIVCRIDADALLIAVSVSPANRIALRTAEAGATQRTRRTAAAGATQR